MKPILFFGEALFDRFYDAAGNCVESLPGGSVLNAAVGAARLGLPSEFSGGIGGDDGARELLRLIRSEGIAGRHIFLRKDKQTCAAEVRLDGHNVPSFRFLRAGRADEAVTPEDAARIDPRGYSCLYCAGIMLASEPGAAAQETLAEKFYASRLPVAFDLNTRPALIPDRGKYRERALKFMLRAQLLKFSGDDLEWLFPGEDAAARFSSLCAARKGALTVMTLGAEGSLIASGGASERVRASAANAVDTTGCGDGYSAGLLRRLFTLPGSPSWDSLTAEQLRGVGEGASAVAARVSEHRGAIAAMPRLSEVFGESGDYGKSHL